MSLKSYRHIICLPKYLLIQTCIHMSRSRRWRTNTEGRKEARAALHTSASKMTAPKLQPTRNYEDWSTEKLINRVTELEAALKNKTLEARVSVYLSRERDIY